MQDLAQMFGGPLALTSANLSSQSSSLNVEVRVNPVLPAETSARPQFPLNRAWQGQGRGRMKKKLAIDGEFYAYEHKL